MGISVESAVKVDEDFVIVSRGQEENLDSNHAGGESGDDANGSGDAFLLDNAHDTEVVEADRHGHVWGLTPNLTVLCLDSTCVLIWVLSGPQTAAISPRTAAATVVSPKQKIDQMRLKAAYQHMSRILSLKWTIPSLNAAFVSRNWKRGTWPA